jgi:uncharacterized membrane protein YbaN (DUF454 family)
MRRIASLHLAASQDHAITWRALAWRALGMVSAAIGVINAFLPLLPTTVFLLISLWAFGKGAPEWRQRLLAHPRWGGPLRHWEQGRRVSRRGKRMASLGIATGWLLCALSLGPSASVLTVGLGLAALALWLWMRPEPELAPAPSRPPQEERPWFKPSSD